MGEVKRYDVFSKPEGGYSDEHYNGRFVLHSDYAALERDYEAAQAELTRLRAVEKAAQEVIAQSRIGRDYEGNRYYMIAPGDLRALAEACGRKG